jgi:aryl-alcohol dehydrogenase-like predicted oxidoreductase
MRTVPLGKSDLTVSEYCLGTMTWGTRNTEAEGHQQMDMALDHGCFFWDTAEMYPVAPISAETVGRTEEIIGSWLAARGGRDRIVLATKVTGPGMDAVRQGAGYGAATVPTLVAASLRRLRTDVIDLYQLHWPDRAHYHFRDDWDFDPRGGDAARLEDAMRGVLRALKAEIDAGRIRHVGLSNDTVWGAARWLSFAREEGLPRMVSVQNEYSLLCRQFDTDWAELSTLEDMPLLAFSPLACGLLSGKYAGDVIPEGTRRDGNPTMSGRVTPRVFPAIAAYLGIAQRHGLDPCQMALAWCRTRPFPTLPIFGATSLDQLAVNLGAAECRLSDEVLAEIAAVHREHPRPY